MVHEATHDGNFRLIRSAWDPSKPDVDQMRGGRRTAGRRVALFKTADDAQRAERTS